MIQVYLQSIHCIEETDEVGADEPYVLVTTVNLASSVAVAGFPVPLPAFDVVLYPFEDMDKGETHLAPGVSQSFWGINGQLGGPLTDPDSVIFAVSLMENDDGNREALRGIVKGIVGSSVLGSLTAGRGEKVKALLEDINSAMGTPTGVPGLDEKIGLKELRFSADELRRAENNETIQKSLELAGDGGLYQLTFEARHTGWNADWFPLPGQAVFDRERQQLAAVSRTPGNLDLFVIGFDNRVWTTFWPSANGWNGDWFPLPGQAVFDHEKQQIAAVSRAPGNLDLFVVGFDNRVWTTFWNDATGWNADWFPLPGQAVFDHVTQRIAAVSRAPGNLDLFVIGFDNRVWTTFWNAGGWNGDWFPLPGQAVFDHVTQQIAAVSRAPGNLDLFVIGFDNHVWTTFWPNAGGWNADWFPLPGQAVFDHERQQITAVSRTPGNLDLFVVGLDSHVWTTFWPNADGFWNADWFPLPGQAVFDRDHQHVAAVSRASNNLDVFLIGNDNHIWTTFWNF
ncbi:hypothetical protein BH09ACT7_BH09ACT7_03720 [soil metagenome]